MISLSVSCYAKRGIPSLGGANNCIEVHYAEEEEEEEEEEDKEGWMAWNGNGRGRTDGRGMGRVTQSNDGRLVI